MLHAISLKGAKAQTDRIRFVAAALVTYTIVTGFIDQTGGAMRDKPAIE
ncbi:MAG: hypothetical protein WBY88_13700 [Desulfosarcina sp.]